LDIPIFAKSYEFYKRLTLGIVTFPKTKRYTLGQKLDDITLEIFEHLISVPNNNKTETLYKVSNKIDLLKILLRLAKDTLALTNKNYLELQEMLQEIGKMLGGWIRATKQNSL
jgi:hypothetical protein